MFTGVKDWARRLRSPARSRASAPAEGPRRDAEAFGALATRRSVTRFVPILAVLPSYRRDDFHHDLVAGLVLGVVTVPQAVAYAYLAGLPAQAGLYACLAPMAIHAVLGSTRQLVVGPVAIAALMVAATVGEYAPAYSDAYLSITSILCLEVCAMLWLLRVLQMGGIVNLLSHPVIAGFVNGAAILIIISQLPAFAGLAIDTRGNPYEQLSRLVQAAADLSPVALAIGGASILGVWAVRRFGSLPFGNPDHPMTRTGPMLVAIVATLCVFLFDLDVAAVGFVPSGLPGLTLPPLDPALWIDLAPAATIIALVAFVETYSIASTLATRQRERVDAPQELLALGASNLGAALTGAYPVAGSFTKSSINHSAGARTPVSMLVCVAGIIVTLLWLTPLFRYLPHATLAAIVIVSVVNLIDFSTLREHWHFYRADVAVHLLTLFGVLILGVEGGLLLGAGAAVALFLRQSSRPHIAVVGRIGDSTHFRNVARYDTETTPHAVAVRVDENLHFANAHDIEDRLLEILNRHPEARHLVLVCSAINFIDNSGLEMLRRMNHRLEARDVALHLSEVKGPVQDQFGTAGLSEELSGEVFLTTDEAMRAMGAAAVGD
ncbi:MAG: sulfate permease [Gammaproteobacteria bacterium]|nr:sulfate permease [Gammaproteobacteria bacterium]